MTVLLYDNHVFRLFFVSGVYNLAIGRPYKPFYLTFFMNDGKGVLADSSC